METLKRALRYRAGVFLFVTPLCVAAMVMMRERVTDSTIGRGFVVGLFASLLVVLLMEVATRPVMTAADLTDIAGINIATMPRLKKDGCHEELLAPVLSAIFRPECRRYHVVGSTSGQGKSLLASALAAHIFATGHKTVLVDADTLRRRRAEYAENALGTQPPCEVRIIHKEEDLAGALAAPVPADGYEVFDHGPKRDSVIAELGEFGGLVVVLGPRNVSRRTTVRLAAACHARGRCLTVVLNTGAPKDYYAYYYGYRYTYKHGVGYRKAERK